MKLNPLHDRVVVKRIEAETQTAGGIYIPDNAAAKPDEGTVLAVGTGKRTPDGQIIPLSVAVNDRIMFGKGSGHTIKVDGQELLVLKEEEIFAVIEEN